MFLFDRSFWKGAAGALIVALLLALGYWTYWRYQEFLVMRDVVAQILKQAQARDAQSAPSAPSPQ